MFLSFILWEVGNQTDFIMKSTVRVEFTTFLQYSTFPGASSSTLVFAQFERNLIAHIVFSLNLRKSRRRGGAEREGMNVGVLYCRPECNFIISRPFPTPHLTLWNLSFTLVAITRLLFKQYFTFGLFPLSPLPCLAAAFVILRLRLLRRRGLSRVFATVKLCKGRRRWLSRRTSDAFFRLCCGALYSLRDASLVLHREVCLAWIRLLPVVCGLYTFWTIARGNALVHRKSWGYTTSKRRRKKKQIFTHSLANTFVLFLSVSRGSTRELFY